MKIELHRGKWSVRYDARSPDGKRRQLRKTFETHIEARAYRAKIELANGTQIADGSTVHQYLDNWVGPYSARKSLSPSTLRGYKTCIARVKERLSPKLRLDRFSAADGLAAITAMQDSGLKPASIRQTITVINIALKEAHRSGLILHPIRIPNVTARSPQQQHMSLDQLDETVAALRADGRDQMALMMRVAIQTGMRRGELIALQWNDIDLVRGIITVRHAYAEGQIKTPKNGKERTIAIGRSLVDDLTAHRTTVKRQRLAARSWSTAHDLVFPSEVGTPLNPANLTRTLSRYTPGNLAPWHSLRHGCAQLMINGAGMEVKELQEMLGHHSSAFTLDRYVRSDTDRQRAAADRFDSIMSSRKGKHRQCS